VTAKRIAEKRYVVKLSDEEREQLNTLIRAGKHPARQLTKARILLKADASEAGERWRDCEIAAPSFACSVALDTSVDTVARTRQQLVEEGLDAVLVRKHSPASARPRIFDGAAEAKLIALACSKPPKGRKRWTLQLLEEQVVELKIVDRASDNTIGRTLKKTISSRTCKSNGSSRRMPTPPS
jgi:poly-gamma-glutamate capsule biosynthesis protein CapA/YwtB (metallophosphatase superfamily)